MTSVTIGAGQGFYGDTPRGALDVAQHSAARYICCDALSELTLAILQRDRARREELGFARDLVDYMGALLPICRERGIRLITNGGGMNPRAAAHAVAGLATSLGLGELRIGVVVGDDLMPELDRLRGEGEALLNADTGLEFSHIEDRIVFASAYLGARPLVEALERGADVIITGRVADASLFVAPLMFEFGWSWDDWDLLASGVVAGHLLECGAQSTGGNFGGDWSALPDLAHIGYPVCEVSHSGELVITKPAGSGGRVSVDSVRQQLLYEVCDPHAYMNPDVTVDLSGVTLNSVGDNRVAVSGVRGMPRPQRLKAIIGHKEGYAGLAEITYSWPEALSKARATADLITTLARDSDLHALQTCVEYLGVNALHHGAAPIAAEHDINEVTLRYCARFEGEREAAQLGRLAVPLALNGPPHIGGGDAPAPPRALIGTWPTLLQRDRIEAGITVEVLVAGSAT